MANYIPVSRNASIRRTQSAVSKLEDPVEFIKRLPSKKLWKDDLNLPLLLNRKWQIHRLVYTRDDIFICFQDEDIVRDTIPLAEVVSVVAERETTTAESHLNLLASSSRKRLIESFVPRHKLGNDDSHVFDASNLIVVSTEVDGYNSGRQYQFHSDSQDACSCLVGQLSRLAAEARKREAGKTKFRQSQERLGRIINSIPFQATLTSVILANFAISIACAELQEGQIYLSSDGSVTNNPSAGGPLSAAQDSLNLFFTIVFTVELVLNMYAQWFQPFFSDGWNLLDLVVVVFSLIGLAPVDLPVSLIISLRAVRVVRLFGKIKTLRKMMTALSCSLPPMMNAYIIIFIIAGIYSVVGVYLFRADNPIYFGSFSRAFVAMFLIIAGEPTGSALLYRDDGSIYLEFVLFLFSYVILVIWIFFQVSVAVLLENYLAASADLEAEQAAAAEPGQGSNGAAGQAGNPLEPLLMRLAHDWVDERDLADRLAKLFLVLDNDRSGEITSFEFCSTLKKLDFTPRIHVSDSDFMAITRNGALCRPSGGLGPVEFDAVMRDQLRLYTHTCLSTASQHFPTVATASVAAGGSGSGLGGAEAGLMCAVKLLLADQAALHRAVAGLVDAVANIPRGPPLDRRVLAASARTAAAHRRRCHSLDDGNGLPPSHSSRTQSSARQLTAVHGAGPGADSGIPGLAVASGVNGRLEQDLDPASHGQRTAEVGTAADEIEGGAAPLMTRRGIGSSGCGQGLPRWDGEVPVPELVRGGGNGLVGAAVGRARFKASPVHAGLPAPPPLPPPPLSPPLPSPTAADLIRHGAGPPAAEQAAAGGGAEVPPLAAEFLPCFSPDTDKLESRGGTTGDGTSIGVNDGYGNASEAAATPQPSTDQHNAPPASGAELTLTAGQGCFCALATPAAGASPRSLCRARAGSPGPPKDWPGANAAAWADAILISAASFETEFVTTEPLGMTRTTRNSGRAGGSASLKVARPL